ncbi:Piso0_002011 [Millerozyma farinosa CBS 7064]|uniref:Piso0_002011 protein n=1 Tax=Pichia sorbitophila (strain ATCC MYA-4447 / BCRC 22081 / CBS 7064 / NBRC 10061 / NRRL Y-12695) TaxID=559304 RepID=G8YMA6_PICSO|nr:Piso0_002011 [Millerozyma farinosa CBS 7064]
MGVVEERHCNGGDATRKVRVYSDHKVAGGQIIVSCGHRYPSSRSSSRSTPCFRSFPCDAHSGMPVLCCSHSRPMGCSLRLFRTVCIVSHPIVQSAHIAIRWESVKHRAGLSTTEPTG